MNNLKYAPNLQIGDFVAVSYSNHLDLGWYCGGGKGTFHYYNIYTPGNAHDHYERWLLDSNHNSYYIKRYEKGFSIKALLKSYINAVHDTRILKIENAENIFTNKEELDTYLKSKEVLLNIKFPAK